MLEPMDLNSQRTLREILRFITLLKKCTGQRISNLKRLKASCSTKHATDRVIFSVPGKIYRKNRPRAV